MVRTMSNDPSQHSHSHMETLRNAALGTGQEGRPVKPETLGSRGRVIKKAKADHLSLPPKRLPWRSQHPLNSCAKAARRGMRETA